MSRQWIYGPRCGIDNCRSRKYTIADDGFKYCSRGHQAADQLIGDDDEWMGTAAKKTRRSADEDAVEPSKYLVGREALGLFLQCFQLLLRKQLWWLMHEKDFPSDIETVTKDLWALRMKMLEPLLQDPHETARLYSSQPSSSAASRASSRSSQHFSATESSDYEHDPVTDFTIHARHVRDKRATQRPRLIDSLGILYLAALLLRLPVSISDVYAWVMTPGFPFLRAVDSLPAEMKQSLPPTMLRRLESRIGAPDLGKIHVTTIEVATLYATAFGMQIPKLNHTTLLVRHMTTLGLPLDVFSFTQHLTPLLQLTHTMPNAARERVRLYKHPEVQLVGLLCIAVKLLYPFDDLPRPPRTLNEPAALSLPWTRWNAVHASETPSSPTISQVDTTRAINRQGAHEECNDVNSFRTTEIDMLSTTEADILSMTGPELDAYMSWFRRTWLPRNDANGDAELQETSDFLKALWSFFPIDDSIEETPAQAAAPPTGDARVPAVETPRDPLAFVRAVQAELQSVDPIADADAAAAAAAVPDADILRAGSVYVHYRSVADIPDVGRPFWSAAAQAVGINVEQLVQVVFALEMKVSRWTKAHQGSHLRRTDQGHAQSQQRKGQGVGSLAGDEDENDPMSLDLGDEEL